MEQDKINNPKHYKFGGIETIDYIDAITDSLSKNESYYIGNIIKYVSRYSKKNGIEDLKKANWYLNRLIEQMEQKNEY